MIVFAAIVDLGKLGIADRWADLAVAGWSTDWNYGPGLDGLPYDTYGVDRDPQRIDYYRLLWDLARARLPPLHPDRRGSDTDRRADWPADVGGHAQRGLPAARIFGWRWRAPPGPREGLSPPLTDGIEMAVASSSA